MAMTPKEKAEELFNKYYELFTYPTNKAKKCALIAVDLLLQYDNYQDERTFIYEDNDEIIWTKYSIYWQEVKKQIQIL
jgi:hypothetical protein